MSILSRHQSRRTCRQPHAQLELLVLERTLALQSLSQRLLKVQDEERRRVARDLHDSTGQTLTALKISVALLRQKLEDDERIREELSEIALLADQALQEIRTTSYLLHPPLLDEAGFISAAQWYVAWYVSTVLREAPLYMSENCCTNRFIRNHRIHGFICVATILEIFVKPFSQLQTGP